jgi:hypothetical protein
VFSRHAGTTPKVYRVSQRQAVTAPDAVAEVAAN